MINELAIIFDNFLKSITNNEWTYIIIGLFILIVLIDCLCNLTRR